jgi:hypothetical protein
VVGDRVVNRAGSSRPVRWIGFRRLCFRDHPAPATAKPVRIAAGAFGGGLPRRDLWVSPEHAVFVDGWLIPARHLVGCAGIAIDLAIETTTYCHVELDQHDIILAEGLPADSWLDTGNRAMFENAEVTALRFDENITVEEIWDTRSCAPLLTDGLELDAIRRRLGAPPTHRVRIDGTGRHEIEVPPGVGVLRLQSESVRTPGEARILAVAIAAITAGEETIALTDPRLGKGFHGSEQGWRWTDGDAHVALGESDQTRTIRVDVCMVAARPALAA